MTELEQILQQVRAELGADFIASDVVGTDGLSIAGTSMDSTFDSSSSAARFAMVVKLASKVSDKLSFGAVEDTLTTTDQTMIITRQLGDGSYFWLMIVTREATLGTVRMTMNDFASRLWNAIPR